MRIQRQGFLFEIIRSYVNKHVNDYCYIEWEAESPHMVRSRRYYQMPHNVYRPTIIRQGVNMGAAMKRDSRLGCGAILSTEHDWDD